MTTITTKDGIAVVYQDLCRQCARGRKRGTPFRILVKQPVPRRRHPEHGYAAPAVCDQCGPTRVGHDGTCVGICNFGMLHRNRMDILTRKWDAYMMATANGTWRNGWHSLGMFRRNKVSVHVLD